MVPYLANHLAAHPHHSPAVVAGHRRPGPLALLPEDYRQPQLVIVDGAHQIQGGHNLANLMIQRRNIREDLVRHLEPSASELKCSKRRRGVEPALTFARDSSCSWYSPITASSTLGREWSGVNVLLATAEQQVGSDLAGPAGLRAGWVRGQRRCPAPLPPERFPGRRGF
ncbi:hypothetical protein GCM10009639_61880 [Kitasatospora putterlickiae]|uniref:Uncharacterized protein n=1 Tax=Kitasatospora putterlickiae TaxID=221725 RepID=A0ABP4J8C0_9ACTN